jgi:tripartite-type tricarboxylate transporter receptor subunit TctC
MRRVLFLIVYVSFLTPHLQAQSDFYKGKQMKIVIGASTGAASDLYARVVAHHLPKQIPGKPDIIVQNMPGGGSITAR